MKKVHGTRFLTILLPDGSLSWPNFHVSVVVFLPFIGLQFIGIEYNQGSALFDLRLMIVNDDRDIQKEVEMKSLILFWFRALPLIINGF